MRRLVPLIRPIAGRTAGQAPTVTADRTQDRGAQPLRLGLAGTAMGQSRSSACACRNAALHVGPAARARTIVCLDWFSDDFESDRCIGEPHAECSISARISSKLEMPSMPP